MSLFSVRCCAGLFALLLIVGSTLPAHAAAPAPVAGAAEITVPMEYRPPAVPYPIVRLRINGHAPLPFLLDTGTNDFVIQPWAVAALALTADTVVSATDGSIQQRIPALKARLEDAERKRHLDVSVTDARVLDARVLDDAVPGTRLAGIVSFGFLGWSVFRLDFAAKTLTVTPPTGALTAPPGATRIPLDLAPGALPEITLPAAARDPDRLILDTGSLGSYVPLALVRTLSDAHQTDYAATQRASTLYLTPQLRLDAGALGPLRVSDVTVVVLPPGVPTGLGLDILSRYRVTFDGPHGQCFFEPNSGKPILTAPSGIALTRAMGWVVSVIDPAAPAAKAGLLTGDTILAIDGRAIDGASKHIVQSLLYGDAGTTVRVTVQRASGAVENITFVRAAFTPALLSPMTGLSLSVVEGGPLHALDVMAGCPADRAGLRVGDTITAINGKVVAALDFEQIADLVDAPKLTLSVTRKGAAGPITVELAETSVKYGQDPKLLCH